MLILASGSPRRAEVLRQLGLDFRVHPAEVDETRQPGEAPGALVERLARAKATTVARLRPQETVVAGDTVVVVAGRVLAKPDGPEAAADMLSELSGRSHRVMTGVAVARGDALVSGLSVTRVTFRELDRETLRTYVATGEPLDKAGGYGIQGRGAALVAGIEGDYYTVVGQPVALLLELFGRLGLRYDCSGVLRPA